MRLLMSSRFAEASVVSSVVSTALQGLLRLCRLTTRSGEPGVRGGMVVVLVSFAIFTTSSAYVLDEWCVNSDGAKIRLAR